MHKPDKEKFLQIAYNPSKGKKSKSKRKQIIAIIAASGPPQHGNKKK